MNFSTLTLVAGWSFTQSVLCQKTNERTSLIPDSAKASIAIERPTSVPILNDPLYSETKSSHLSPLMIATYTISGLVFISLVVAIWYLFFHKRNESKEEKNRYSSYKKERKMEIEEYASPDMGQRLSRFIPAIATTFSKSRESHSFSPRRTPSTTQLLQSSDVETTITPSTETMENLPHFKEREWRRSEAKLSAENSTDTKSYSRNSYQVW
ncbi:hypothetical protein K7432_004948 [Basidiobolus ranarum]|uniref:Uncharacterized protein n=1 Tax=Basidiobolus ranarum TaxID=34480 RepID=A0ABR2W3U3_9FUNG